MAASVKPLYVWCGLGLSVAAAVGVGGWALYGSLANPVADQSLKELGYEKRVLLSNMEVNNPDADLYHKKYSCFDNFFPGSGDIDDRSFSDDQWDGERNSIFDAPPVPNATPSSPPIGCALMGLYYRSKEDFLFKSEVAIKSGGFGMVLWNKFEGQVTEGQNYWGDFAAENSIIFLEKKGPDQWSIVGSFYQRVPMLQEDLNKINISIDAGRNWTIPAADPDPSSPITQKYFGLWEVTDGPGSEEIFRQLRVDYDGGKSFVLNGKNADPSGPEAFMDYGIYVDEDGDANLNIYDLKDKNWISVWCAGEECSPFDDSIKQGLRTFYGPFRGKRGKWVDFDADLCERFGSQRNTTSTRMEALTHFCYSKKSDSENGN